MTTSPGIITRIAAFAFLLVAAFGIPTTSQAQIDCVCKRLEVEISPKVACAVTLCVQLSPSGPIKCQAVNPGSTVDLPCPPYALGIQLCDGNISWLIGENSEPMSRCTRVLMLAPKCCVQACVRSDEKTGCPEIVIEPALCLTRDCSN